MDALAAADIIPFLQDRIPFLHSTISENSTSRRETKCEVHDDMNKYLKCRRSLLLKYCGEVCDTTPEIDESKYYAAIMKSYVFRIIKKIWLWG